MGGSIDHANDLVWQLLYTKPRAEFWTEVNLRNQGFEVVLPRVPTSSGWRAYFPRYVFVGFYSARDSRALTSTRGVIRVVTCGSLPAKVPSDVVAEIRSRMDSRSVVIPSERYEPAPLFASRERERTTTLLKFAAAGFRVKAA